MNRLEIPERKIDVQYPSSWDEIGSKHAERIGEIMYQCYTGKIDYDMARKLAVDEFLNRENSNNKPAPDDETTLYWINESRLADTVNWLFTSVEKGNGVKGRRGEEVTEQTETVQINPKFCAQLIPFVKIGDKICAGPKDLIADLTIYEWKEASWRMSKYAKTLDDRYLDELFEVLYCRGEASPNPSKGGETEDKRRQHIAAVPIGVKFMSYLFFLGCMNWLREEPIEIDGEEIRFECLFPKNETSGSKDEDHTGLTGILFQMAESGVFGNMEQTSKVNMWDVFLRLYQIHYQIKRLKT